MPYLCNWRNIRHLCAFLKISHNVNVTVVIQSLHQPEFEEQIKEKNWGLNKSNPEEILRVFFSLIFSADIVGVLYVIKYGSSVKTDGWFIHLKIRKPLIICNTSEIWADAGLECIKFYLQRLDLWSRQVTGTAMIKEYPVILTNCVLEVI